MVMLRPNYAIQTKALGGPTASKSQADLVDNAPEAGDGNSDGVGDYIAAPGDNLYLHDDVGTQPDTFVYADPTRVNGQPLPTEHGAGKTPMAYGGAYNKQALGLDPMTGYFYENGQVDYGRNYYGMDAAGERGIERVGQPGGLSKGAFQLSGFGGLQNRLGAASTFAQQAQLGAALQGNANAANVGQSRALALGALTAPGPSAAEGQLFQGQEAAARNALAMARSGRGFGSAGQMRSAQFAGQEAIGAVNQQAATLRAQEEAQRRQQLLALGGMDLGALGQSNQQQVAAGGLGLQALGQTGQLSLAQQQALADRAKFDAAMRFDAAKTNAGFANYNEPTPQDNTWRDWASALGAGAAVIGAGVGAYSSLKGDSK